MVSFVALTAMGPKAQASILLCSSKGSADREEDLWRKFSGFDHSPVN